MKSSVTKYKISLSNQTKQKYHVRYTAQANH